MYKKFLVILFVVSILTGCARDTRDNGIGQLEVSDSVLLPDGYELVGASAHGQYSNHVTLYLQKETGEIFTFVDGNLVEKIDIPQGYQFLAASAHGQYSNHVTIYCMKIETGEIFTCK